MATTDITIPNIAHTMAPRASLAAVIAFVPFVGLLAWLSARSTIASFTALPSQGVVGSVDAQMPVAEDRVREAVVANLRSATWFEPSRYRLRAARVLLALRPPARADERARVEQLTRESLAGSPMTSYGWTLLSFLRFERGDVAGAATAWETSAQVGRYVPNVMQSRLLLGMRMLPYDRDLAPAIIDQIRVLAEANPRLLARAARHGGVEAPVRAILAGSGQSTAFEQATSSLVAEARARIRRQQAEARR